MDRSHLTPRSAPDDASATGTARAPYRAPYRAPQLRVIGDAAVLTQRNWFAPGRVDGSFVWRRTG